MAETEAKSNGKLELKFAGQSIAGNIKDVLICLMVIGVGFFAWDKAKFFEQVHREESRVLQQLVDITLAQNVVLQNLTENQNQIISIVSATEWLISIPQSDRPKIIPPERFWRYLDSITMKQLQENKAQQLMNELKEEQRKRQ